MGALKPLVLYIIGGSLSINPYGIILLVQLEQILLPASSSPSFVAQGSPPKPMLASPSLPSFPLVVLPTSSSSVILSPQLLVASVTLYNPPQFLYEWVSEGARKRASRRWGKKCQSEQLPYRTLLLQLVKSGGSHSADKNISSTAYFLVPVPGTFIYNRRYIFGQDLFKIGLDRRNRTVWEPLHSQSASFKH